jgi:hypothetical protein
MSGNNQTKYKDAGEVVAAQFFLVPDEQLDVKIVATGPEGLDGDCHGVSDHGAIQPAQEPELLPAEVRVGMEKGLYPPW